MLPVSDPLRNAPPGAAVFIKSVRSVSLPDISARDVLHCTGWMRTPHHWRFWCL